jgi:glycerol-3-phosphate dehydrogenase
MGTINTPLSIPTRAESLAQIEGRVWDVVVIGGGISGAGVAQQAAQHGWSVLLVEQKDFAWGTSSRSSKLVHGGLRYLKEGDIKTTLHSVRERQRLMREAPELVEPQSFLFASCKGRKPGRWLFQIGLMVYDLMAGQRNHFWADAATTRLLAPGLEPKNMQGAMVFGDAKTDDARLVWRVLAEAQKDGAVTLNYASADNLHIENGKVTGLSVIDGTTGQRYTAKTKAVVNATGAWADRLRGSVQGKPMLRPLRGSHLVVPFWRLPVAQSISFMHARDGRPVFLYPWEGATLIGTTDLDHQEDLDLEASISPAEVSYLLEAVNEQFPETHLGRHDISACYAGVRPVVASGSGDASKAARDHAVLDESGLITLAGGKLTTFRLMAQDALALAAVHVGKPFARNNAAIFTPTPALNPGWSFEVQHRLAARYGYRATALCQAFDPQLGSAPDEAMLQTIPGTNTLWLELPLACKHEAVVHLDDLLLRRTRLGILLPRGGLDHLVRIKALCQPHLAWDEAAWNLQIERYRARINRHYQLPTTP